MENKIKDKLKTLKKLFSRLKMETKLQNYNSVDESVEQIDCLINEIEEMLFFEIKECNG